MTEYNWYQRISEIISHSLQGLYERDQTIRLSLLGALAGESVFLLGPPGVGKSLISRRLKYCFKDGRAFEYLMGRFSTPDEIFGPVSIQRLTNQDRYERLVTGYLPDADIVFLDEVWNASPPIQNALLTAMNEKRYRNGTEELIIPLKLLIGASNSLHPGEETAAFWDRFLIRIQVQPIEEKTNFLAFLADQGDPYLDPIPDQNKITREEWQDFQDQLVKIELPDEISGLLYQVRSTLDTGHPSSDRRWKKILRLLKASALANGRRSIGLSDCFLLEHCLWETPSQAAQIRDGIALAVTGSLKEMQRHIGRHLEESRANLRDIEAELRTKGSREVLKPRMVDGEYHIYIPRDAEPSLQATELRIWHPDTDPLFSSHEVERHAELFQHQDGRLVTTLRARLTALPPTTQEPYRLQAIFDDGRITQGCLETKKITQEPSSPEEFAEILAQDDSQTNQSRLDQLLNLHKRVKQAIGDIDALGEQLSQEAREHLFTPKDELLVLDTPLLEIATGLVNLQNRIQLYISTISPGSASSGN